MRRANYILGAATLMLAIALAEGITAAPRSDARNRRSRTPLLKKGDKAPDFALLALSDAAKDGPKHTVTLADAIKDRPAAVIFSSFT